jgi:hypothetical protein
LRLKSLRFAGLFRPKKPLRGTIVIPRARLQPLISGRNLLGCHGFSSVKEGLGRPKTGSALHYLVTALSVKKALTIGRSFCVLSSHYLGFSAGDAPRTHSGKMRTGAQLPDCAEVKVKE